MNDFVDFQLSPVLKGVFNRESKGKYSVETILLLHIDITSVNIRS